MVERDVVLGKAATIERCLARVEEVRSRAPGALLPIDVEDIVVLNVTRAAQAAADLAAHVVAAEGYGLPDSLAAAFSLLERQGVIDVELAVYRRNQASRWELFEFEAGGAAELASVGCSIEVDEVYRDPLRASAS